MSNVRVNQQVRDLTPYKPGMPIATLARKYQLDPQSIIKVASNENPLGCSAQTTAAIKQAASDVSLYPDQYDLRNTLASFHDIDQAHIVLGNGSNDIIDLVARACLNDSTESICSQYGFIIYQLVTTIAGGKNVVVPANGYGHDLSAMLAAITPKTRVIWIANPNNPTGTFIPQSEIIAFLDKVPDTVLVVLDEAYYEYLGDDVRQDGTKLVQKYSNLIVLRTFSKAYGLAGARIGYGVTSVKISDYLNRLRQPFNASSLALAGATAALADQEHVVTSRKHNTKSITFLQEGLQKLNVKYIPSYGNFVTIQHDDAERLCESLLKKGIITRPLPEYGLADHIRISTGTDAQNQTILATLGELLASS